MSSVVRHARFPQDARTVLQIWREYIASPSASLDYQDYEAEFADLPGKYAPPEGRLPVAENDGSIAGCASFRKVSDSICEMKRLYVPPSARGTGLGRQLDGATPRRGEGGRYEEMRLDVLEEFKQARKLYAELGFVPADPASFNPPPGTSFLGLRFRYP